MFAIVSSAFAVALNACAPRDPELLTASDQAKKNKPPSPVVDSNSQKTLVSAGHADLSLSVFGLARVSELTQILKLAQDLATAPANTLPSDLHTCVRATYQGNPADKDISREQIWLLDYNCLSVESNVEATLRGRRVMSLLLDSDRRVISINVKTTDTQGSTASLVSLRSLAPLAPGSKTPAPTMELVESINISLVRATTTEGEAFALTNYDVRSSVLRSSRGLQGSTIDFLAWGGLVNMKTSDMWTVEVSSRVRADLQLQQNQLRNVVGVDLTVFTNPDGSKTSPVMPRQGCVLRTGAWSVTSTYDSQAVRKGEKLIESASTYSWESGNNMSVESCVNETRKDVLRLPKLPWSLVLNLVR